MPHALIQLNTQLLDLPGQQTVLAVPRGTAHICKERDTAALSDQATAPEGRILGSRQAMTGVTADDALPHRQLMQGLPACADMA